MALCMLHKTLVLMKLGMFCWKWCADTPMDAYLCFFHIIYVISLVTLHFNVVFQYKGENTI